MRKAEAARRAARRRKTAAVTRALERSYGRPKLGEKEEALDCLIGCMLSQNTTDSNSDRAWGRLRERFPRWEDAARAPAGRIEAAIRVAGLGRSRSRRIKAILTLVKERHGGYDLEFLRRMKSERAFEYLSSLDGVGKKTAGIVLLFALGRDVFPVDTHVHVICRRLGLASRGATRDEVFEEMASLVPRGRALSLHLNMIRFGKERCTKRNPECGGCPLRRHCVYVRGVGVRRA